MQLQYISSMCWFASNLTLFMRINIRGIFGSFTFCDSLFMLVCVKCISSQKWMAAICISKMFLSMVTALFPNATQKIPADGYWPDQHNKWKKIENFKKQTLYCHLWVTCLHSSKQCWYKMPNKQIISISCFLQ